MNRVHVRLVLVVVALGACAAAQAEERVIVIPRDNTPFTVAEDEVVRLSEVPRVRSKGALRRSA
jgi:hypothetical protein